MVLRTAALLYRGLPRVLPMRVHPLLSRRFYLSFLFICAVSVTWGGRWARVQTATPPHSVEGISARPGMPAPARLVATAPTAATAGLSQVWLAPELPPRPSLPPDLYTSALAPTRTPAAEVDRWMRRLAEDLHGETHVALERLGRYERLVYHALSERGLPTDLIYLALIESGYSPTATSRAGAVGIWQFMPETARRQGLEVSEYVDERRDPIRSTFAAIRHLEWLHRQFGSWHLAVAAYNAGHGRVGRALGDPLGSERGDESAYWSVRSFLPSETREYVPKLLAAARIARAPEQHGFTRLVPREPLRFRELPVPGGTPLDQIAELLGVPADLVYELNPHLKKRMTPPGRPWPVRVPAELPGIREGGADDSRWSAADGMGSSR
jgi:soluble lytic murein transglycosylase-like protein